uniref:Inositol polyphosphate-4-phosphatase type II B n=1 Tax=Mola mola TaxID=94237 RepID=A0A3Q3WKC7_MOLML
VSVVFSFSQRSFLGFTSVSIRDLLRSKEPHVSLSLRGENLISHVCVCMCVRACAVLCAQVCKVYRFQTEDRRWLLVREQMSETPLSFSLPKQLLGALMQVQEVKELGDLSPHWDGLRHDVINHCNLLIGCYQETLAELDRLSGKGTAKEKNNTGTFTVITFGAPADHHQSFKHGGLKRLLSRRSSPAQSPVSYSRHESSRARELLASVAQLQPLVFGLVEELLSVSQENRIVTQTRLPSFTQTQLFVHALKDELVEKALLAIGSLAWVNVAMSLNCIITLSDRLLGRESSPQQATPSEQQEVAGDTNSEATASSPSSWQEQLLPLVVTLRDCVREAAGMARTAMTFVVLQGAVASTVAQGPAQIVQRRHAVFSQALTAAVCGVTLKLYGALDHPELLQQLHNVGVLAQFESLLSTYGDEVGMLEDMEVGVANLSGVAFTVTEAKTEQLEDLLPTLNGECLVVEVPLPPETFRSLPQELKEGRLIRLYPVLFNIGINQQQSLAERYMTDGRMDAFVWGGEAECGSRMNNFLSVSHGAAVSPQSGIQSLSDLLSSLGRSIESRKRKNVEVLWIAAMVCRAVNGVRLTSCKSAKDRTAMSVTLEQCVLLRERHTLGQQHFSTALDRMRRLVFSSFSSSSALAPKAPRRHWYPVAFLLVTSHLLVLWLILSLVVLLVKYQ